MIFSEPPRSEFDLNFALFGFPVRVHPYFWLIAAIIAFPRGETSDMRMTLLEFLVWIIAIFAAIVVHELGHALAMRWYGFSPRITLHGFGGVASYNPSQAYQARSPGTGGQILISAAGPAAGFLLAGLVAALVIATGHSLVVEWGASFGMLLVPTEMIASPLLTHFVFALLQVCIVWGFLNLMPIYPLDGGQICREVCQAFDSRRGIRVSLILSVGMATVMAVTQLVSGSLFTTLLFGYLAYTSYQALQAYDHGPRW